MRIYILVITFLLFALSSCSHSHGAADEYDLTLYSPTYASGFDIKGAEGMESTVITVRNPWQGADSVTTKLFIARNGEKAPADFDGCVIDGEARRIVTMSSSHIAMLDALSATDRIVGVSGIRFVSNADIQARRDSIGDVGYDGNINYETILALAPDLVLIYGVNGESPMTAKLKELDIPYMYVADYLERSPLGKAEWLVAMAEIIGQRFRGEEIFARIPENYNSLKQRVTDANLSTPKVMINTPITTYGTCPRPTVMRYGLSTMPAVNISTPKTGATHRWESTSKKHISLQRRRTYGSIPARQPRSTMCAMVPKFSDTTPFVKGMIFNNNLRSTPNGGNDYYESGIVHPDLMLRDLIKIFHPELVSEDFVYHKQLK